MTNTALFIKGTKSTLQLEKGINLSYQNQGVAIYNPTQIDQWNMGDFVSADYIINAEFGNNERETIHATLVAMPGQSSITVYGRTSLTRQLINVSSNATNSYAQLIVEPASNAVQGSIVTIFANYAKSSKSLVPFNSPAQANSCSWSAVSNTTSLIITVGNLTGTIQIGQIVSNPNLPTTAIVTSWNSITNTLVVDNFAATSFSSASNQQLVFSTGPGQLLNSTSTIAPSRSFGSIYVPGQQPVVADIANDTFDLVAGYGIKITTQPAYQKLTISNQAITSLSVSGQASLDSTISNINSISMVAGAGITLTTNPLSMALTITANGITTTTDDSVSLSGSAFTIKGSNGLSTSTANGIITINNSNTGYNKITDGVTTTTAASRAATFRIRSGTGITATVTADGTIGDNVLISNNGVLTVAGLTGTITVDQLISAINGSLVSSINLPIGTLAPNIASFTSVSTSGLLNVGGVLTVTGNAILNNGLTVNVGNTTNINGPFIASSTANLNGALTVTGTSSFTSPLTASSNATFTGNTTVTGTLTTQQTQELYVPISAIGTTISFNFISGAIYLINSPTSNFTAAFSNVPTTSPYTISVSLILNQGSAAGYIPTVVSINGVTQTIRWQGGSQPSATANHVQIVSFVFIVNTTTTLANGIVEILALQSSTVTQDNSANAITLSNTGSVTSQNSTIPFAATYASQFNGSNYLRYNSSAYALGSVNWTIEFFMYTTVQGTSASVQGLFSLETNQYVTGNTANDLQIFLGSGGNITQLLAAQTNQTTTDNSINNLTLTASNITASSSTIPFSGTNSVYNGNGTGYLTVTNAKLIIGLSNFTIEGYVYIAQPYQQTVFILAASGTPSTTQGISLIFSVGSPGVYYWTLTTSGTFRTTSSTVNAPSLNTWYHFAIQRSNNLLTLYINGISLVSIADTNNYSYNVLILANQWNNGTNLGLYQGYLSNFRFVIGTAVYTAPFTPPGVALTATQTAGTNIGAITGTAPVNNGIYVTANGQTYYTNTTINTNTWYHMALVKNGTTDTLYLAGTSIWSTTGDSSSYTGTYLSLGYSGGGNSIGVYPTGVTGYLSNFRITSNVAVYTGTFTPPAVALTTTQSSGTNISAITTTSGYTVLGSLTDYN
jgi:Concanavalin A-like lectin/glucanases superfamily